MVCECLNIGAGASGRAYGSCRMRTISLKTEPCWCICTTRAPECAADPSERGFQGIGRDCAYCHDREEFFGFHGLLLLSDPDNSKQLGCHSSDRRLLTGRSIHADVFRMRLGWQGPAYGAVFEAHCSREVTRCCSSLAGAIFATIHNFWIRKGSRTCPDSMSRCSAAACNGLHAHWRCAKRSWQSLANIEQ